MVSPARTVPSTADLLREIFEQPTAPFREFAVRDAIQKQLEDWNIPNFLDRSGNLIAGVKTLKDLSRGFRIAMIAHMDHPGFHLGKKLRGNRYRCHWYGGGPLQGMLGASVRCYNADLPQESSRGKIVQFPQAKTRKEGLAFEVLFEEDISHFSALSFGGFDFPGLHFDPDHHSENSQAVPQLILTRAADDLAGCVISLGALIDQERSRNRKKTSTRRLVGIFTRAEEVGFAGCLEFVKDFVKIAPPLVGAKKTPWFLSLEASRALPEAEASLGPVIRIGDKSCLFDAEFSALLWTAAQDLKNARKQSSRSRKDFMFQRRLMSGGTCEATPLSLFGYKAGALAVPLLNYHNCGISNRPAPEGICLRDVEMARELCAHVGASLNGKERWRSKQIKRILDHHRSMKPLLEQKRPRIAAIE